MCLVTGGAQGIGWAIATALADRGAIVHACDISGEHLERATSLAALRPPGGAIHLSRCDAAVREQSQEWIAGVHRREGRVDVLVNNCAYVRWTDLESMSWDEIEQTVQVGLLATVYATKAVVPLMRAGGYGHIIAMGSAISRVPIPPSSAAYAAVKAGVEAFIRVLQAELTGTPVHTTLIRPVTVGGTDFFRRHVPSRVMPRITDFLPTLTPSQVAGSVIRVLERPRPVVDIPAYLPLLYGLYGCAPTVFRRLTAVGGAARKDFGAVPWHQGERKPR
ncbi:SDR family oxidoreductase [Streptomyces sp. FIT100]|uniref:SDR family NAD(P)-dependent oxidoreductase n=1 Tax=Streptomyces sp. FIT100 TaxID=2837956 RepID=UPI0021C77A0D|nr:SDR family oxidoreductase [Streptomyces sp. FIT100]UUN26331.1 SDR family oxidoreductase [Streptomyces sp. FIT100]